MIIQLEGKVTYPITLDPTVWIFDDRKILFEQAFSSDKQDAEEVDEIKKVSERFEREYFIKPPVNQTIKRFEGKKVLENSYVMPIRDFIQTADMKADAKQVRIETGHEPVFISIEQLTNSLLLFAKEGKPLKEDGPAHLFFGDGSNVDEPIKNVKKLIFE
ncbi:hypothetical protein [Aquibacillus sediminis]|uniref:hypothetical protein n=1 Tax=Aquibacillus sediminis TaxID=2574734 RepID=UPI001109AC20|nr:hypothetical protein [Aquibacillus sediminis]